jgi:hypothetical protein
MEPGKERAASDGPRPTDPNRGRAATALQAARIGLGLVWALNLAFVLYPPNEFFPTFGPTVAAFAPTTWGGPALPEFIAAHAALFSVVVAGLTAYLAVAFLTGLTLRSACILGAVFNLGLLVTQYGTIVVIPGGTDVGPQPLYLVLYAALFLGSPLPASSPTSWADRLRSLTRTVRPLATRN